MKHFKEITRQTKTQVVNRLQCDLCKKVATDHLNRAASDWRTLDQSINETTVVMKTGQEWPGGGSGEETEIDICPDCFRDKLIPWVKEQGGEPTVTEWDW